MRDEINHEVKSKRYKMKHLFIFLFLTISFQAFSQAEIMDSIEQVRNENKPELAQSLCTPGYWTAETDGGERMFRQICSWGDRVLLVLKKEQKMENRAVLTVDFYRDSIPRDRIYIYLIMESDAWLIDGINETERLIKLFLEGLYSAHFSPTYLPKDTQLIEFGEKILSFERDEIRMLQFLEENTAPESEHDFISQMTTDMNFEQHFVNRTGYEERTNVGYIHFMGKHKYEGNYFSNLTIYVSKTENGKLKILDRSYGAPYARGFFYNLSR